MSKRVHIATKLTEFINEQNTENRVEFNYKNNDFIISHVHTNTYRVIDKKTRTWTLIKADSIMDGLKKSKKLIDELFTSGIPNFTPMIGEKFIVTGEKYEYGEKSETDGITFTIGSHWKNIHGTGKVLVKKGDIIAFNREGEDYGWWYIGGYEDAQRSVLPWVLLWSGQIRKV